MDQETADEALMLRYRDGDTQSFEVLYARHKGPLYRYLLRQCGEASVEELFQDIWLRLIRARDRYTVQAKFSTYLYQIAHNRVIDHYRQHARAALTSFDEPGTPSLGELPTGEDGPLEKADQGWLLERLLASLARLPAAQREVFLLREEAGLSLEDIAAATGTHRETVKSRLRYAVTKLKRDLGALV